MSQIYICKKCGHHGIDHEMHYLLKKDKCKLCKCKKRDLAGKVQLTWALIFQIIMGTLAIGLAFQLLVNKELSIKIANFYYGTPFMIIVFSLAFLPMMLSSYVLNQRIKKESCQ